jgi:hypothetical protein
VAIHVQGQHEWKHWALHVYESATVSGGPQTRLPAYGPQMHRLMACNITATIAAPAINAPNSHHSLEDATHACKAVPSGSAPQCHDQHPPYIRAIQGPQEPVYSSISRGTGPQRCDHLHRESLRQHPYVAPTRVRENATGGARSTIKPCTMRETLIASRLASSGHRSKPQGDA